MRRRLFFYLPSIDCMDAAPLWAPGCPTPLAPVGGIAHGSASRSQGPRGSDNASSRYEDGCLTDYLLTVTVPLLARVGIRAPRSDGLRDNSHRLSSIRRARLRSPRAAHPPRACVLPRAPGIVANRQSKTAMIRDLSEARASDRSLPKYRCALSIREGVLRESRENDG